jgi:alpha-tubulin suppressor-like RCC1 family protein
MDRQHKTTVITALRGKLLTLGLLFFAAAAITGCDTPENDVTAPKIVAGAAHACAFDADREQVVCWGDNSYGQLGNEEFSAEGVSAPVRVKVISGRKIKSLSAGYSHTCALVSGGDDNSKNTVACWGYNHYGQVGNGTFKDSNVPVFVNGPDGKPLTGVVNVSAGAYHTCASIVKGSPSDPSNYVATTYCWGRNDKGQIGNGALTNVNVPTEIKGLDYSSGVAAGTAHTCALTSKSTDDAQAKKYVVMCWGDASRGQMREAKVESGFSTKPVDIGLPLQGDDNGFPALFSEHIVQADVTTATGKQAEGEDALAVAPENSAYGQTCALSADQALCWGGSNQNGQWGTDKKDVTEFAVKTEEIVNGSSLKAYGAGNAQSCMLVGKGDDSSANEVACWGFTSSLGFAMPKDATDAVVADNRKPVPLQGSRPTGLAVGREFVCYAAKGEQPQIWCWGTGKKGQIGNGTIESTRIPQCVKGYCPETKKDENLVEGQPFADAPGAAPFVVQVSAGYLGTCAVIAGGTVKCWGDAAFHDFRDSWTHYENWADREYPPSQAGPCTAGASPARSSAS